MIKKYSYGVQLNDIVSIDFIGKLKDETEVLSSKEEGALTFQVGRFEIIKGLNSSVIGMTKGQSKKFSIPASEAFGDIKDSLIKYVPIKDLPIGTSRGAKISFNEKGRVYTVIDVDKNSKEAILDANHLLAGQEIKFEIKILNVRRPSREESYSEITKQH